MMKVPGYVIVSGRPLTDAEVANVVAKAREDWPDVPHCPLVSVSHYVPPATAYLMRTDAAWAFPEAATGDAVASRGGSDGT